MISRKIWFKIPSTRNLCLSDENKVVIWNYDTAIIFLLVIDEKRYETARIEYFPSETSKSSDLAEPKEKDLAEWIQLNSASQDHQCAIKQVIWISGLKARDGKLIVGELKFTNLTIVLKLNEIITSWRVNANLNQIFNIFSFYSFSINHNNEVSDDQVVAVLCDDSITLWLIDFSNGDYTAKNIGHHPFSTAMKKGDLIILSAYFTDTIGKLIVGYENKITVFDLIAEPELLAVEATRTSCYPMISVTQFLEYKFETAIDSIKFIDNDYVLVTTGLDIHVIDFNNVQLRGVYTLPRLHHSCVTEVSSCFVPQKSDATQLNYISNYVFFSSSLDGQILSWRISLTETPSIHDATNNDQSLTDVDSEVVPAILSLTSIPSNNHPKLSVQCDRYGLLVLCTSAHPGISNTTKEVQVNVNLTHPFQVLSTLSNPLFLNLKEWVLDQHAISDVIHRFLLITTGNTSTTSNSICCLLGLSISFFNCLDTLPGISQCLSVEEENRFIISYAHNALDQVIKASLLLLNQNNRISNGPYFELDNTADDLCVSVVSSNTGKTNSASKDFIASFNIPSEIISTLTKEGFLLLKDISSKDDTIREQRVTVLRVCHLLLSSTDRRLSKRHSVRKLTITPFQNNLRLDIRLLLLITNLVSSVNRLTHSLKERNISLNTALPAGAVSKLEVWSLQSILLLFAHENHKHKTIYGSDLLPLPSLILQLGQMLACANTIDEHCPVCKETLNFDPENPFLSACLQCYISFNRCVLTLRIINFGVELNVLQCSLCRCCCFDANAIPRSIQSDDHFRGHVTKKSHETLLQRQEFDWAFGSSKCRLCPLCAISMAMVHGE